MTSKERIRATIEHKPTDRIPSTMQCVETEWDNMKKHFGVEAEEEVMDILEIDTRILDMPPYIGPENENYVNEDGEDQESAPQARQIIYIDLGESMECYDILRRAEPKTEEA